MLKYLVWLFDDLVGSAGERLVRRHVRETSLEDGYITQEETPEDSFDMPSPPEEILRSRGWDYHVHERHHVTEVFKIF